MCLCVLYVWPGARLPMSDEWAVLGVEQMTLRWQRECGILSNHSTIKYPHTVGISVADSSIFRPSIFKFVEF